MKNNRGITLVALIITIIVMLILVAVSVSIVINSGLLTKAKEAGDAYTDAAEEERTWEEVNINNQLYDNVDEYITELNGG